MLPDVVGTADAHDREAGFVVRADRASLRASGPDARRWLHDLATADVASLPVGGARRSLLLTPTGRIRADLQVLALDADELLLIGATAPGESLASILSPYRLSAAVELEPRDVAVVTVAPAADGPVAGARAWRPSIEGDDAADVVVPPDELPAVRAGLADAGFEERPEAWLERRRILHGSPRFGADFGVDSLPAEAGLDDLIDRTKGCFLGQESVAKVRDLGHPPRVLRHLRAASAVEVGTPVGADGTRVGEVTSRADDDGGGTVLLARVRWDARDAPLVAEGGAPLSAA